MRLIELHCIWNVLEISDCTYYLFFYFVYFFRIFLMKPPYNTPTRFEIFFFLLSFKKYERYWQDFTVLSFIHTSYDDLIQLKSQHGMVVVSSNLCLIPSCVEFFSGYVGFFPHSKDMHGRLIEDSKLPIGVKVTADPCSASRLKLSVIDISPANIKKTVYGFVKSCGLKVAYKQHKETQWT